MMRLPSQAFVLVTLIVVSCPAIAAESVAYTRLGGEAYLIDWLDDSRAHVVANWGNRGGEVSGGKNRSIITLDSPHSYLVDYPEYCDEGTGEELITIRRFDVLQLAVTRNSGTAARGESTIAPMGTITTLQGCGTGEVTAFGSPDAGIQLDHLAMSLRPSMQDLVPGAGLAGPAEGARVLAPGGADTSADLLTFFSGNLAGFARTGTVVETAFTPDQWLVLQLPEVGERAYARISVDTHGAEMWLDADWSGGAPVAVQAYLMTMATERPGFVSVADASRVWQSGTTGSSRFYLPLYEDFTGEQIGAGSDGEIRTPLTWRFAGSDLIRTRVFPNNTRERTWTPVARHAAKGIIFVLEQHIFTSSFTSFPIFKWRVNYWYDRGVGDPSRHYGPPPKALED